MFPSFIVTFREVLEMALIIGVMLAATKGLVGRHRWVAIGFAGGIAGSAVVAMFTETISNFAEGIGQELFNALILFTASLIIGWTAIWMRVHAREMIAQIKEKGGKIVEGDLPKITLSAIIALAVLREGSEIVLFTYGMLASGKAVSSIIAGSLAGLGAGTLLGGIIYLGLVKVPTKHVFQVTTWLLLFLTAGMASVGAKYLVAAGYFSSASYVLWDTSWILSETSIMGQILHALLGYSAQPMAIQAIFYILTLGFFVVIMYFFQNKNSTGSLKAAIASVITFSAILAFSASNAEASKKVYSPYVDLGEIEFEIRSGYKVDADEEVSDTEKHKFAVGYGVTDRWFTEIYAIVEKDGAKGSEYDLSDVEWENRFQLTEQGQYFVDVGLYAAYEVGLHGGSHNKVETQLLLAKDMGNVTNYANIELNRQVGENSNDKTNLELKWSSRYRLNKMFTPGFEVYSELGAFGDATGFEEQEHQIGPALYGKLPHGIAYEAGYLFGASQAAPDGEAKVILEYEIHF